MFASLCSHPSSSKMLHSHITPQSMPTNLNWTLQAHKLAHPKVSNDSIPLWPSKPSNTCWNKTPCLAIALHTMTKPSHETRHRTRIAGQTLEVQVRVPCVHDDQTHSCTLRSFSSPISTLSLARRHPRAPSSLMPGNPEEGSWWEEHLEVPLLQLILMRRHPRLGPFISGSNVLLRFLLENRAPFGLLHIVQKRPEGGSVVLHLSFEASHLFPVRVVEVALSLVHE